MLELALLTGNVCSPAYSTKGIKSCLYPFSEEMLRAFQKVEIKEVAKVYRKHLCVFKWWLISASLSYLQGTG